MLQSLLISYKAKRNMLKMKGSAEEINDGFEGSSKCKGLKGNRKVYSKL